MNISAKFNIFKTLNFVKKKLDPFQKNNYCQDFETNSFESFYKNDPTIVFCSFLFEKLNSSEKIKVQFFLKN